MLAIRFGSGYFGGRMAKLVFDIETTALPVERFDEGRLEYLFRDAQNLPDPAQREARRAEIQRCFSLWPLTGQIVCIAMSNVDSFRSKVLFLAGNNPDAAHPEPPPAAEFVPCQNEAELLNEFWEAAVRYESIITFNGRTFDIPFLYLRSALLDVDATSKLVEAARSNVELATRALSDETDRVNAGVDDNLPLVTAQATLASAESNLVESLFQYNLSKLALARAAGIIEQQYRVYLGR